MYRFTYIFIFLLFSVTNVFSQETTVAKEDLDNKPIITFDQTVYNYGNITPESDGIAEFRFKNTGKTPLVISSVVATCGCTVPDWDKVPIMPGKVGSLKVRYDTKRIGPINKMITVNSNASNPIVKLSIKGNVAKESQTTIPTTTGAVAPFAQ